MGRIPQTTLFQSKALSLWVSSFWNKVEFKCGDFMRKSGITCKKFHFKQTCKKQLLWGVVKDLLFFMEGFLHLRQMFTRSLPRAFISKLTMEIITCNYLLTTTQNKGLYFSAKETIMTLKFVGVFGILVTISKLNGRTQIKNRKESHQNIFSIQREYKAK